MTIECFQLEKLLNHVKNCEVARWRRGYVVWYLKIVTKTQRSWNRDSDNEICHFLIIRARVEVFYCKAIDRNVVN